jgi:TfoX/Sxy family transcriptional regulator of competence genes
MAYDDKMADRIREIICASSKKVEEKKMFAGLCFMVNGKMCVTLNEERLMLRVDPERGEVLAEKDGCTLMKMKGKELKGYVIVYFEVVKTKKKLESWLKEALTYNSKAKASKKKTVKK